ncbi:MAG: hypothetical protein IJU18_00200 [Oscillospiraceae bacterium]|nr:hypothetical protein [Oscillospiraceae bacterium]
MSFNNQKITSAEIAAAGVQSRPNKLTGTAAQNKAAFDALVETVVMPHFNSLIDELQSAAAAWQIGVDTVSGISAATVQEALEAIVQAMQDITQGSVADGSITTAKLAESSVTAAKIAALAITTALIADGAVPTGKVADGNITTGKIAALAVTTALLAAGAVTTEKLADLAVTAAKIANATIDNTKLAQDAVTTVKIADLAVTAAKIAAGAVTAAKLGTDILPSNVGIKMGTATPTTSDISNGQIYLKYEA